MTKSVYCWTYFVEQREILNSITQDRECPKGVEVMGIRFNKFFRASKKSKGYVNPEMIRNVELAREKAWHDAYLSGGVIG